MDIFEFVHNEKFFNILTGKNRKIFYDCMLEIMEMKNERPVLYETEVRQRIELYLRNNRIETIEEDENAHEPPAAYILNRLREYGWLTGKEKKGLSYTTGVTAPAMRIMGLFIRLTDRQNEKNMTNRILNMHRLMRNAFEENAVEALEPYRLIVSPLHENTVELRMELEELRDSVATIMRILMQVNSMDGMSLFFSKNQLLRKFFHDYFFMKSSGLIPAKLRDIEDAVRRFLLSDLFEKAVRELAEKESIQKSEARARVKELLEDVHSFVQTEYDDDMRDVEAKINTYYNMAYMRLTVMLGSGTDTKAKLDAILHLEAGMKPEEKAELMRKLSGCVRVTEMRYVSTKSFARKRRDRKERQPAKLAVTEVTEEERRKRTDAFFEKTRGKYTPDRAGAYFAGQPFRQGVFETGDAPVKEKEDALMYAAAMMYARSDDFPYKVEIGDGTVTTEAADITKIRLTKRGEQDG